jgi:hypothetical protein
VNLLGWIFTAIVLPLILSEFTDVSPWLARKLIGRAARRLPEQDRPRWEEEWLGELEERPGRLSRLLWALWSLPLLRGAGEMGRMLGSPPVSEALWARIRAAWQKLRLWPKAPSQEEPEPVAMKIDTQPAIATAVALPVSVSTGGIRVKPNRAARWSQATRHLSSQRDFEEWLTEGQQLFEKFLVQQAHDCEAYVAQQYRESEEYRAQQRQESTTT